jgi:hypothetical protein
MSVDRATDYKLGTAEAEGQISFRTVLQASISH